MGRDTTGFQGLDIVLDEDSAEVEGGYGPVKGEVTCDSLAAHVAEQQAVIALSREGLCELAVSVGGGEGNGFLHVRGLEELEYCGGLAFA